MNVIVMSSVYLREVQWYDQNDKGLYHMKMAQKIQVVSESQLELKYFMHKKILEIFKMCMQLLGWWVLN